MPAKRKAKDIATPTRPPASRARSARTSKAAPATDGNDSESPPPRLVKKPRGAASRVAKQNGGEDDDFGDYGRGSSKPATIEQHLMDQNKKSKAFIQSFKEQVAQGREQAEEALARLKQDLTKPPTPGNGIDTLSDTYTTLHTAAAAQPLSTKDNPLFSQTQHLLRLSRAVLRCHQTVDAAASRAPPDLASPRETWKQDEEGMRTLLAYGRVHGERAVEGWIAPRDDDKHHEMTDGEEEGGSEEERERRSEAENLARGLFEWRRKGRGLGLAEGAESWGVAARRQMGALVGVVRTLPSSKVGK